MCVSRNVNFRARYRCVRERGKIASFLCRGRVIALYNLLSGVAFFESSSRSNRLMSRSVRDKVHNNDILADFLGSHVRADYTITQCTFFVSGFSSFPNFVCFAKDCLFFFFLHLRLLVTHFLYRALCKARRYFEFEVSTHNADRTNIKVKN